MTSGLGVYRKARGQETSFHSALPMHGFLLYFHSIFSVGNQRLCEHHALGACTWALSQIRRSKAERKIRYIFQISNT
ncbi:hypothetical protein K439DRAFT_912052 [Ramaria rubella]|nr:hypothetical protein K439DRAFT_49834 [Ramaria rubella]KAF8586825.1 hypothetical protein K439DRAFT_912052 [Ramaria rubella]